MAIYVTDRNESKDESVGVKPNNTEFGINEKMKWLYVTDIFIGQRVIDKRRQK